MNCVAVLMPLRKQCLDKFFELEDKNEGDALSFIDGKIKL